MFDPLDLPKKWDEPFTDYSHWRLVVGEGGRHTWKYLHSDEECEQWPQTSVDKYWIGIPLNLPTLPAPKTPLQAAQNGYTFYQRLQSPDGHWAGEYGGPMFILPGIVIGSYVTGMSFTLEERLEMVRYLFNRAHPEDGGWGLHIEDESTVFGTAMCYVSLRLLGVDAEHPVCVKARATLHQLGGATAAPSWGKVWLAILNVYDWAGLNPVPPEILLLPEWTPVHPHRWWIQIRTVYIPMSYLYAVRFQAPENELISSLRNELYTEPYCSIHWSSHRNNIGKTDLYAPHSRLLDLFNNALALHESVSIPSLRKKACERAYELVVYEDENTGYQTLAPVSMMLNTIVRTIVDGPESDAYKQHEIKRRDCMWLGAEGMMCTGTNGSQLWDLAFVTQALVESGLGNVPENRESLLKALSWLDEAQIRENPKHHEVSYRHATKGAWSFSTKEQGYTLTDCTGEALKAVLYLQNHLEFTPKLVSERRICDAVDLMLGLQNPGGGFASYELIRGPQWLEYLNSAEVFGDIMIEHCYPECTTSVITALAIFRKHYPAYRTTDIEKAITQAVSYLHEAQRPDGSWFGSWGICFTYATQFALESLSLVGEVYSTSDAVRRACAFLLSKQREDGGWGESYKSCVKETWVEHANTQVVQTSWAVLALIYARYPHPEPIEKGVQLVMSRQLPDGSWAQEAIEGIFNKNCTISYPNFKFSFTIWMLGKADAYLKELRKG